MIRFFNANNPSLLLVLFFYALVLNLVVFLMPEAYDLPNTHAPLSKLLYSFFGFISFGNYYAQAFFSVVLVYSQAIMFNAMVNRYKLFERITFVPALMYILMAALMHDYLFLSPVLFSNFLVIITIDKLFAIYKKTVCFQDVFDIGFLIGISSLIYLPTVTLLIILFIALGLLRPFIWREWVIGLLGFLTPNILVGTYYFLNNDLGYFFSQHLAKGFENIYDFVPFPLAFYAVGGLVLGLFLISVVIMVFNYMSNPIQVRKYLTILFWTTLLLLFSFVLMDEVTARHFTIITVPLSFIITYGLMRISWPKVVESVYWILLLTVLSFQYLPFFEGG